jgi:hypothetical protein
MVQCPQDYGGTPKVNMVNNIFMYQSAFATNCIPGVGNYNDYVDMVDFGTYGTYAAYRTAGFESANGGLTANPNLDITYKLQAGSPAIGKGTNLTSLGITALNFDKSGSARPASGDWDIGAYQYTATEIRRMKDEGRNTALIQLVSPNPIKAALLKQYQQMNKDLKIYDLAGNAVKNIGNEGIYLVQAGTQVIRQRVVAIK